MAVGAPLGESAGPELFVGEPLIAWRAWTVGLNDLYLRSVTYKLRWPKRKPMRCHCSNAFSGSVGMRQAWRAKPHASPSGDHTCGIHAVKDIADTQRWVGKNHDDPRAGPLRFCVGTVKLWGRILQFEGGYRAEYAYPKELWIPSADTFAYDPELLVEQYGVEMRITD